MPTTELTDAARYDYGQELMQLRVKKGVSVDEVAAAISRSTSAIYMAQTGKAYCEPVQEAMREYLDGLPDGDGGAEVNKETGSDEPKFGKVKMKRSWKRRTRAEIAAGVPKHGRPSPAPQRQVFMNEKPLVNDRIPMPTRSQAQIEDEAEQADVDEEDAQFDAETLRLSHAYRAAQKASQSALDALVAHLDS